MITYRNSSRRIASGRLPVGGALAFVTISLGELGLLALSVMLMMSGVTPSHPFVTGFAVVVGVFMFGTTTVVGLALLAGALQDRSRGNRRPPAPTPSPGIHWHTSPCHSRER